MEETAKNWLQQNYERLGLEDYSISEVKSGESNHNLIIRSENERYVLRVSRDISREDRLRNEAEKLGFLEDQDIEGVPRKLFFSGDEEPGSVLLETFVGQEDLDAEKMNHERLRSLAERIADIHAIPLENYNSFYGADRGNTVDLRKVYEDDYRDWSRRPFREYKQLVERPDPRLGKYFERQKQLLKEVPEVKVKRRLVHGDLGFNIRATGNRIFIVDWEFSRLDYPGNEILYCFEHEGLDQNQRQVFLQEYRKHRELGPIFEKIRKIYPGFLAFNDAVWAAKRVEIDSEKADKHGELLETKLDKLETFYKERDQA